MVALYLDKKQADFRYWIITFKNVASNLKKNQMLSENISQREKMTNISF